MDNQFKNIEKVIKEYIKFTLKCEQQINIYIPNSHIAEKFKTVLINAELENENAGVFNSVNHDPVDTIIGDYNPDDYEFLPDGKFLLKQTYSVSINHILIPKYFDLKRLQSDGINEISRTYKMITTKDDLVRNNIILSRIVLPEYTIYSKTKSYKIKIK